MLKRARPAAAVREKFTSTISIKKFNRNNQGAQNQSCNKKKLALVIRKCFNRRKKKTLTVIRVLTTKMQPSYFIIRYDYSCFVPISHFTPTVK